MTERGNAQSVEYLLSPIAIRETAEKIFAAAENGRTHFRVHAEKIPETARFVLAVTRQNYPDLKIPFHSRWGHFQAGGIDRLKPLRDALRGQGFDNAEIARCLLDLAMVSVLLDAGAGMAWRFREEDGREFGRSEGLAIASLYLFLQGRFSGNPRRPLQVDSQGLLNLKVTDLAEGFQVSATNPLQGLEGRFTLMRRLGEILAASVVFHSGRPGDLLDYIVTQSQAQGQPNEIRASFLLRTVLHALGPIWPGRSKIGDTPLGDVWPYQGLTDPVLVPFHKLSQWMTYSLIEPLEEAGLRITHLDELTGLAEYRNGGLMLDAGLIELRDPKEAERTHLPESDLIIEWRALTLALLDRIAGEIRAELNQTADDLPLVKVLEGGTWWAGRRLAAQLRPDGGPPLRIQSDGTVF